MWSSITAAVLEAAGRPLQLREVLIDEPAADEALVRVERVGLCHSDLHYLDGTLSIDTPAILGHEVAGTVEAVGGAVQRLAPGDRVVATVTPACGLCAQCLRGRPTQCGGVEQMRRRERPRLLTPDGEEVEALGGLGAFAEAFLAREASLAVVDRTVPPEVACLLGCCVTTGVGAVMHGAEISPEDTVAVIGCGGVGMAVIQGARLAGARRIVAVDVLAPTGTATILGLMPEGERVCISADALVYGDRVLRGAYMGANRFLSDVVTFTDHYRAGRLDLDAMVTVQLPFTKINEGFRAMSDPRTIRVVLEVSDDQP